MIDLDEFDRIVNCFPFDNDILALSKGECKDLLSRLRQAEKDAARYRWLMENCGKILEPSRNRTHMYIPNYCPLSMDYVDVSKHIDEAIQCNK